MADCWEIIEPKWGGCILHQSIFDIQRETSSGWSNTNAGKTWQNQQDWLSINREVGPFFAGHWVNYAEEVIAQCLHCFHAAA